MSKKKTRARRFVVAGVNLGDGDLRKVWVVIDEEGMTIRAFRGRKRWWVPLSEAASIVAVRAQRNAASRRLGTEAA